MSVPPRLPPEPSDAGAPSSRSLLVRTLAIHLLESPLDLEETIETAAGAVIGTIADSCTVFLFEYGGSATQKSTRHRDPTLEAEIKRLAETYRPDAAAAAGSPVPSALAGTGALVDWRLTDPADDLTREAVQTLKSKAWLALPLRDPGGKVVGAMRFSRGREEPPFDEVDTALAHEIATLCGTAIARSQTAQGYRKAIESLTRDLAPSPLPTIPGLELGVRYHSGTSEVGVGGDWCDAVRVNGRVVLAVGDAAGHGIAAAVTMNEAASALRAFAFAEPSTRVVRNLDRYLANRRTAEMVTACVIDLNLQSGRMKIANAGHMPPILASSRTTKYLDKGRTAPLGSGKASGRLRAGRVRLQTGDRLFLYTDGLVERRGEVIDIGIDRLVRAVANAPEDIGETCDHILERMAPRNGFSDDVALLAVKLLNTSGAERW